MKLKEDYINRMKELLGKEYPAYCKVLDERYINSIRCNTLKISPEKLKEKLSKKWKIKQPFKNYPEIMMLENQTEPGEIGKSIEHLLGYFYVQETSSMMPVLVLNPKSDEVVLDIAAAPGSKTTQIAARMENQGVLIANDPNLGRIKVLSTNTQRCGVTNLVITQHDGANLCNRLERAGFEFDKILLDAPCSGEGTLRTSPKTAAMFSEHMIRKLSAIQKSLIRSVLKILKVNGTLIYSTCTHAPEENEAVIDFILKQGNLKLEQVELPIKTRPGITSWKDKTYDEEVKKCARIYPMDNNTEGFFVAKLRRVK